MNEMPRIVATPAGDTVEYRRIGEFDRPLIVSLEQLADPMFDIGAAVREWFAE